MKRSSSLLGLLKLLGSGPGYQQQNGCLQISTQLLPPTQLQPLPRMLTSAARRRATPAAEGKAAARPTHPSAAAAEPAAATAAGRKPLSARTRALLAREELLARFAMQLGMEVENVAECAPSIPTADLMEVAAASQPWSSTVARAEEEQEKREKAWKNKPIDARFPTPEAFDEWLAAKEHRLQPVRAYLSEGLGLDPEPIIHKMFRMGPRAQAMMFPEEKLPALASLDGELQGEALEAKGEKSKKGKGKARKKKGSQEEVELEQEAQLMASVEGGAGDAAGQGMEEGKGRGRGRGRKKKGASEEEGERGLLGAAQLVDCDGVKVAGEASSAATPAPAPGAEQQGTPQQHAQQAQQEQEAGECQLPRLASAVAQWQAVFERCGMSPKEDFRRMAQLAPQILMLPPPGGVEEVLAQLDWMRGRLSFSLDQFVALVRSAPQLLVASRHDIERRLELLRHHAHVAAQKELESALYQAPQLVWMPEAQLLQNTRTLVRHCKSVAAYAQLVHWHPQILLSSSASRASSLIRTLEGVLPEGWSAPDVVRERPQLLLSRPGFIRRNWKVLKESCAKVPVWQEELDRLLGVPGPAAHQQQEPAQQQEPEQKEQAWGAADGPAPSKGEGSGADTGGSTEGSAEAASEAEKGQQRGTRRRREPEAGPTRRQYHEVARLLDARPDQVARLAFLLEAHPSAAKAGEEPLLELLTMRPRVFERNYPGMQEWVEATQQRGVAAEGTVQHGESGMGEGAGDGTGGSAAGEAWALRPPLPAAELGPADGGEAAGVAGPADEVQQWAGKVQQSAAAWDGTEAAAGAAAEGSSGGAHALSAEVSEGSVGSMSLEPPAPAPRQRRRQAKPAGGDAGPEGTGSETGRSSSRGSSSGSGGRRGRGRARAVPEGPPLEQGGADIADWWDAPHSDTK